MDRQIASNFNFLNGCFDELASIAKKAELLYSVDADSCAAKLRLFGEFWLYEYNRVSGNKIKLSGTFGDLIATALNEKLIGDEHYDLLEPLRSYGNLVSHVRFSQMSQKASSGSVTKTQLKSNFIAIMSLADALVEKSGLECAGSSEWIEPIDLISALDYQYAIYDNPESVLKIAKLKLAELSKLPHSKKRVELVSINAKIEDCEYWLTKAYSAHAEQAEFESYLFYMGHYHPTALNIKKAASFKTQATSVDVKGGVHLFLAIQEFNTQRFDKYKHCITQSIERGNLKALDHYLSYLCNREECNDEYRKYLKIGLDQNHIPCLITHAANKIVGLQNASEEAIKPAHKDITRLLIKLKAMKSGAAKFVEALSVAVTPDGEFTSEYAKNLVNGAKSLPNYCMASSVTLYAMHNNSDFVYATKTLIEQALRESEGSAASGAVYFFAAMAIFDTWHRNGQVLVPGLATEKLIRKSVSLGFQPAIDLENDSNAKTYIPRAIKNKRAIRKQTKAQRKQSRKNK